MHTGIKLQLALYKDALQSSAPNPHLVQQSEEVIDRAIAYRRELEDAIADITKALYTAKIELEKNNENSNTNS